MNRRLSVRLVLTFLFIPTFCLSQTDTGASGAKTNLVTSLSLISGGQSISDMTLSATVVRPAFTSAALPTTIEIKGTSLSKLWIPSSADLRTEVAGTLDSLPACAWTSADGSSHPIPFENCAIPGWFLPQFGPLARVADDSTSVRYVGRETKLGEAVDHYSITVALPFPSSQQSTTVIPISSDIYLDSSTNIPVGLRYFAHPNSDLLVNLPVEVRYSDYRLVNGAMVPFKIVKLINGAVLMDISVNSASMNTGIVDTEFSVQ